MFDTLPETAALVDSARGLSLSYAQLAAAVSNRADELAPFLSSPGARAVIAHEEGAAFLVDLFAIWQVGGCAICLPASLTQDERDIVARMVKPAMWIGAPSGIGIEAVPLADLTVTTSRGARPAGGIDLDRPALVLMTSGTTSSPKGVVHSLRSLLARISLNIAHIGTRDLTRGLTVLPMHFGHGLIGNSLTTLAAGGTLIAAPPGIDGLSRLGETIDRHAVTFVSSVPAMWRLVLRAATPPRSGSLRRVHVGSAPLDAELWSAIINWAGTRRVVNMYGMTETANWIGGHDGGNGVAGDGLVGRPWGGAIRVRGDNGGLAACGRGEVAVSSPGMMLGYFDRPDLTHQALRDGWLYTGDIGELDADGQLRIVGRIKHEINRAGIKVPAEEIDLLLQRHRDIEEACAFAWDDPVAGETVAAAIVRRAESGADCDVVLDWCRCHIREEAVPSRLFLLDSLAKNARGKLDREQVKADCRTLHRKAVP